MLQISCRICIWQSCGGEKFGNNCLSYTQHKCADRDTWGLCSCMGAKCRRSQEKTLVVFQYQCLRRILGIRWQHRLHSDISCEDLVCSSPGVASFSYSHLGVAPAAATLLCDTVNRTADVVEFMLFSVKINLFNNNVVQVSYILW